MEIVAIIPERKGSKGIKDKNISLLNGKPLMVGSIEYANQSHYLSRTIGITDSEEYRKIDQTYNADLPLIQPDYISSSDIHAIYVIFTRFIASIQGKEALRFNCASLRGLFKYQDQII